MTDPDTLTREELYELVWQAPMRKLATKYGLSDVGLAKICTKYDIPRPPVGYWAKLAHGKKTARPALPILQGDDLKEIKLFRQQFFGDDEPTKPKRTPPEVEVSERLIDPHLLVRQTMTALAASKPNEHGLIRSDSKTCLNIIVTKQSLTRALRVFDAIIKAWEKQGGEVGADPTEFRLDTDAVKLSLSEVITRKKKSNKNPDRLWYRTEYEYTATGQLALEIDGYGDGLRKKWADGKIQKLEDILGNFILTLDDWMEHKKNWRLDSECRERQRAKAAIQKQKLEKLKEFEQERRKQLHAFVDDWHASERIRAYLKAVKSKIESGVVSPSNPESFAKWLDWARWYADYLCPITPTSPRTESVEPPTNTRIEELDLTSKTRSVLLAMPFRDSNELAQVDRKQLAEFCLEQEWRVWDEVQLVLAGLGYQGTSST